MAVNVKRTREEGTICVTNVATAKAAGKLIVVGELVACHKLDQAISATNCPVWVDGVEVLYAKGLGMGTLLAFMMAVVALSLPEMILLRRVLRPRLIGAFVGVVATGILLVGYLFNAVL